MKLNIRRGCAAILATAVMLTTSGCSKYEGRAQYSVKESIQRSFFVEDEYRDLADDMINTSIAVARHFNANVTKSVVDNSKKDGNLVETKVNDDEMLSVMIYVNPEVQEWLRNCNKDTKDLLFKDYSLDAETIEKNVDNVKQKLWPVFLYSTVETDFGKLFVNEADYQYYQKFEKAYISYNKAYFRGDKTQFETIQKAFDEASLLEDSAEWRNRNAGAVAFALDPARYVYAYGYHNSASAKASENTYKIANTMTGLARQSLYYNIDNTLIDIGCVDPLVNNPDTGLPKDEEVKILVK